MFRHFVRWQFFPFSTLFSFSQVHIPVLPRFLLKMALRCLLTSLPTSAPTKISRAVLDTWLAHGQIFRTKRAGPLCPRAVPFLIPALQMLASLDWLPPGLALMTSRFSDSDNRKTIPWGTEPGPHSSLKGPRTVYGPQKDLGFQILHLGCELRLPCISAGRLVIP